MKKKCFWLQSSVVSDGTQQGVIGQDLWTTKGPQGALLDASGAGERQLRNRRDTGQDQSDYEDWTRNCSSSLAHWAVLSVLRALVSSCLSPFGMQRP